jgi:hypothetical protein
MIGFGGTAEGDELLRPRGCLRRGVALALMSAIFLACAAGVPGAVFGSNSGGWEVVGQGSFGRTHWAVEMSPDRSGVCLEDLVFSAGHRATALGAGQCSHPVASRGLLVGAVALNKNGRPLVTVIGGAFAPVVAKVVVERFDGSEQRLPVRRKSGGPYRYLAFGQRGVLCARRITTVSAVGQPLRSATWKEFSRSIDVGARFDPRPYC